MKVAINLGNARLDSIPDAARRYEGLGYDVFVTAEAKHNPFFPLVLAAEHTSRIALRTSVAIAFPRSPMTMASVAWDLQSYSKGRLQLGLGSQVRGHIVRRFSTQWTPPAPRMREYVHALKAIWDCWQNGTKLDLQGDHYSFNLMSPFFNPGPIEHPRIPVYVSAMNPNMLKVAGETCDGVILHPLCSLKYARETILPNLEAGTRRAGRSLENLDVSPGGFVVLAETEEEMEDAREAVRRRISFYASTMRYRPVMSAHGWDDTAEKLYRMSLEGRWDDMKDAVTDEMIDAFATVGGYHDIVDKIKARYGDYATSVDMHLASTVSPDEDRLKDVIARLQAI